jgi:hypothetical protein
MKVRSIKDIKSIIYKMIIDKEVYISICNRNISYYKSLNYDIVNKNLLVKVEDILKGSSVLVNSKCDYCGHIKKLKYKEYIFNISYNNKFSCSSKCGINKTKETNLLKYGVEYASQSDIIKNKAKNTCIEKYGVEYASQTEKFRNDMYREIWCGKSNEI